MGLKKDDSCGIQKSSFNTCVVFLPVSTLRGTDHTGGFVMGLHSIIQGYTFLPEALACIATELRFFG